MLGFFTTERPVQQSETPRVEDGRNGKTWYSKRCESKFGTEGNKYWLSDKQLHRDLDLESGFSLGAAEKRETVLKCGARGGAVGWGTALQAGRSQESLELFTDISFRPRCGPGIDSACNRNEYQEYFLGCKGHRCVGLQHLHMPIFLKFGSLKLLEPSGLVQACNGITLPYIYVSPY